MSEDKPKRFPIPHPGVLLAVALVLVVIADGLSEWMSYHRQQVAIQEFERLGGTVKTVKRGHTWLLGLVGDECEPYRCIISSVSADRLKAIEHSQHPLLEPIVATDC